MVFKSSWGFCLLLCRRWYFSGSRVAELLSAWLAAGTRSAAFRNLCTLQSDGKVLYKGIYNSICKSCWEILIKIPWLERVSNFMCLRRCFKKIFLHCLVNWFSYHLCERFTSRALMKDEVKYCSSLKCCLNIMAFWNAQKCLSEVPGSSCTLVLPLLSLN